LEKHGFRVTYVGVDENGIIKLDELKEAICDDTILITVMMANNEIGTIQPIEEIGKIAKEHKILFHTDAVQAVGQLDINLSELPVDMLSISGHKFGAPKGIGLLYVKSGVRIDNLIHGGGQERGKRAGTENTPYIIGLAKALELAVKARPEHVKKMTELRNLYISEVEKRIPYIRLNGHRTKRLCTNANFSFSFIEGESLLLMLDMNGIAASSGSACTSGSLDPSHVLLAIGLPHETAHGSLRVTFGDNCTKDDVMYIVDTLEKVVSRLRDMSPLYEKFLKEGK
ncbi:MAG: aminotransferase class V-fold PLP-dependent enzyme, partial [Clostridia bacterium]|nr:aminotransferase class V-fold PLP-dependent enzyme [Clostridia bacterium]